MHQHSELSNDAPSGESQAVETSGNNNHESSVTQEVRPEPDSQSNSLEGQSESVAQVTGITAAASMPLATTTTAELDQTPPADTASRENAASATRLASPEPRTNRMPAAYIRLKEYCEKSSIKCSLSVMDPDFPIARIEFPNGRKTRNVTIFQEEDAEALLEYPLSEVVFLGGYSAACSYENRWIEAAVRPHGIVPRGLQQRRIFGKVSRDEKQELDIRDIPASTGLTVKLTERDGVLSALGYPAPIYLRIEGIGLTEHDRAVALLEDLSNSLFMQIDFRFDIPLSIAKDRSLSRRLVRSNQLDEDNQVTYPRHSYDKTPSALYWYARSATSMPLLQFLAFYQCIEFFFPQFSRLQTIAKIKNVLKDPMFDGNKDSDINLILNATMEGRKGSLLDERKQLRATLAGCVDAVALRDFLNETDQRKQFYTAEYRKVCDKRINLSDDSVVVEQTAERIYDIRCKVVHAKNLEGSEEGEMILPFSKEADLLGDDVDLVKFLARKVLVASSVPFRA